MWSALGNEPINETARWVPEPNFRGSYSILSSCLVTLTLCVWTVLHLNVPEHQHQKRGFWWKALWLVTGLLAPEIVAFAAYIQYAVQSQLTVDMEEALAERNPKLHKLSWYKRLLVLLRLRKKEKLKVESHQRLNPWTTTHSYLAVMGGFAFDNTNDESQCPLPDGRRRVTLTSEGLVLLAKLAPDLIPDVSLEAIRDKSKTNSLTKLIAFVQALWFCLQVITRLGQHLPVTLLEMNTFAHAFCALFIFVIWWDKPLDISEAFVLSVASPRNHPPDPIIQRTAAFCAAMCNRSRLGSTFPCWVDRDGDDGGREPYHHRGFFRARGSLRICDDRIFDLIVRKRVNKVVPDEVTLAQAPINRTQIPPDILNDIREVDDAKGTDPDKSAFIASLITDHRITLRHPNLFSVVTIGMINFETPCGSLLSALCAWYAYVKMWCSGTDTLKRVSVDIPSDYWIRARLLALGPSVVHREDAPGEDDPPLPVPEPRPLLSDIQREAIKSSGDIMLVSDRATNVSIFYPPEIHGYRNNGGNKANSDGKGPRRYKLFTYKLHKNDELFVIYAAVFAASSVAYGGWHLLAWGGPFHGHTQMLLWRGSGIGVGAAAVAIVLHSVAAIGLLGSIPAETESKLKGLLRWLLASIACVLQILIPLYALFVVACRLCLVVESLVGLAYVPDGVFELPNWSLYFPHIA